MAAKVAEQVNAIADRFSLPLSRLEKFVPAWAALLDSRLGNSLGQLYGLSRRSLQIMSLALAGLLGCLLLYMIGLLAPIVQLFSLLSVARNGILSLATSNTDSTKALIFHLVLQSALELLSASPVSFLFSASPFFPLMKSVLLLLTATPETGASLYLYARFAGPFFGENGRFSATKVKVNEVEPSVVVCVKMAKLATPCSEPMYCIASSAQIGLRFLTKARQGGSWYENMVLPISSTKSGDITFAVMSKAQFGADKLLGNAVCSFKEVTTERKALDLEVRGMDGSLVGTLSVDLRLA